MLHKTLLGAAAVLAIGATSVHTKAPDFSGRWIAIPDASSSRERAKSDTAVEYFTIVQKGETLTLTNSGAGDSRMIFHVEQVDRTSVRAKGPVSVAFHGVELSFDSTMSAHFKGKWGDASIEVSSPPLEMKSVRLGTYTLSLDRSGALVVQVDNPASGDEPAKRSIQRYRRA